MLRRFLSPRFFSSLPFPAPSPIKDNTHLTPLPRLLHLLNHSSTFEHIAQIHGFMLSRGLDADNLLLGNFIHACSLLGFKDYAFSVFERKDQPDIYLYNTTIRSLSKTDSALDAISLFSRIQSVGLRPDTYSFPFVLKVVARLTMLELGEEIHGQIVRVGLRCDIHISTGLINMYSACGDIQHARLLFDEICHRDVVSWNAMVAGYVKVGDMDNAHALFGWMPERNVISWTTMIAGYAQMNRPDEAVAIFRRMQLEDDVEPDEVALLGVLSACAQLGALDLGEWIHGYVDKHRLYKTVPLMNALIDMYAKSGNIDKAMEVFENMKHKSIVTWTTMIAGFALHGLGNEALDMFDRMERENVKPNDVTFLAILSACSHAGQTHLGRWYFRRMRSLYNIKPRIEHYGCMVDLLGRAGFLGEACDLIRDMPFEANGAIWGALLAAARIHDDVELGLQALRHLIEVEPQNGGNYILLSNIYAAHEKWDDVGKLRKVMKDRGVNKVPGGSSIEVDGMVHEFTSRDGSHPCFERIYRVLYEINGHLKMIGYVPRLHGGLLDFEEG
ncbi:pentatricopeptide repeat-containing protein At5g56310 [Elaeis guineensis]|uniref:Pentatricopeptide repeat-containing protein At5g56310 n=1 Tax=Elaeis guineensis var. tenera TaxID=51953 RepID=A0A6I9S6T9_ELAGV|nr:pentatricopeptide repeat-containing protein At5g56310 [Elaeis guineensis]XP_010938129.1 pentatricopeptide repeat-containing protein At5g56310 [Elaeis guineensis]